MNGISIVLPDGSMMKKIMNLFSRAGIPITMKSERTKEATVDSKSIGRIVFQRPQEIPGYIQNGLFDIGFAGQDQLANSYRPYKLKTLLELPMGRKTDQAVKIVVAAEQGKFKRLNSLPFKCNVATEYKKLARIFFCEQGRPDIQITRSYGNTEHKPKLGLAVAIVDVVESGESLEENGLEIIQEIMPSSVVLAANVNSFADENKRPYIECFANLINGAFQASKYVLLVANVPEEMTNEAIKIMKGLKGPTCSPIIGMKGWVALQSVIPRKEEGQIIFQLGQIGIVDIFPLRDIPMLMMERPAIL